MNIFSWMDLGKTLDAGALAPGFNFLGDPIVKGDMFNVAESAIPLAVDPAKSGLYSMQNGIAPGEWDWMNNAGAGNNMLGAFGDLLTNLPKPQQAAQPTLSPQGVGGKTGSPIMTEAVKRKIVNLPRLVGG